jgi:hypothetical protein
MFQLTQDHINLIKSLRICETVPDDVASSDSHFYQEGEVLTRIGEIASAGIFKELFENRNNVDKFNWLKSELHTAFEVVLSSGSAQPGTYLKDERSGWVRVQNNRKVKV